MPERRYSDDEVKRILSNAVESDAALSASTTERGMTLAEIERIGLEAGLTPASVRAAATSLDYVGRAPTDVRMMGMRVGVGQSVMLARPLDDTEWRRLVVLMRDLFQAQGSEHAVPGGHEWRNGNLRVSMESLGDGAVLQMRTRKGGARSLIATGLSLFLGGGVIEGVAQLGHPGVYDAGGALSLVLTGAILAGVGVAQVRGWSAARQTQFQEIADYARQLSASDADDSLARLPSTPSPSA